MICKVQQTLDAYAMLQGAQSVCAGVSGGMDSMCMLDLLQRLQPQYGYTLQVVHVNHQLRGESADADAAFVQKQCELRGLSCTVVCADVAAISRDKGIGLEEAGRLARYAAFEDAGCDRIAVAHTLTDRIETSLFHLTRGTALRGAAGIPPVRGKVIRPLIGCTRAEIEAYVQRHNLPFVTDESNNSDAYTRNCLRHHVLPQLRQINPAFEQSWARFLETAALQDDYLTAQTRSLLQQAQTEDGFLVAPLQQAHPALRRQAVLLLLTQWMSKMPEERHVQLCLRALCAGKSRVTIGEGNYFAVQNGVVRLQMAQPLPQPYCVAATDGAFYTPNGTYVLCPPRTDDPIPPQRQLDAQKLHGTLTLRTRQPGDRFLYPDRQGTKTLKKLMNELKLTPQTRASLAVLCCGDEIAYLEGIGASRPFAATPGTKQRLVLQKKEDHA